MLCSLYGKSFSWFLTGEENDEYQNPVINERAKRVSRRIAEFPREYQPVATEAVEHFIDDLAKVISQGNRTSTGS